MLFISKFCLSSTVYAILRRTGYMEIMDCDKITVLQLKEVLKQLGLSSKSNKQELLRRLFDHDPTSAWKQWVRKIPEGTSLDVDEATVQQHAEESIDEVMEEEVRRRVLPRSPLKRDVFGEIPTLQDKELDILRREQEIMQRELEILRRERDFEVNLRILTSSVSNVNQNSMRPQPKALSELQSKFSSSEDTFRV